MAGPDRPSHVFRDAVYLALAEVLDAPLLTADAALGEVPGSTAVVDVRRTA